MTFSAYREKDLAAWEKWNKSRSDADLTLLLRQVDGVIQKEVNRWAGVIARPVLEAEARRIAKGSFETFDPNRGVAVSTYLTNSLKKLSRITYKHQNPVYIPEHQVLKIGTFDHATRDLQDRLGRDPTTDELADHLTWNTRDVTKLQQQRRSEFITSGELPGHMFQTSSEAGMIDFIYHDLNPTQKIIFEHTTGYGGKPVLSNAEIQKKLRMTQGTFSYEKRKVVDKIKLVLK